ncbi:hypothetical protein LAG90_07040 [Marinilongibacter aquaticus]|uniref:hypothetical protein n=1 Tax=Marinilongibacter aquaticus TaxID=2975157 RepID=UPI0021BD0BA6|nr:hypothetical protein [Marinilongibacter aquaticus]UBM60398.1 hypothetical protein LAG90_07040 [Marinilongibacter aquaticus]
MRKLTLLFCLFGPICFAQNWFTVNTAVLNNNATDSVYRKGPVLISDYYTSTRNNHLGVISRYNNSNNRALYLSLNEPDNWFNDDGDSTRVGLALADTSTHTTLVATHFANFYDSVNGTDVHNSTSEFGFVRGMSDLLGFRDGGRIKKAAVLKLTGTFAHNERAYSNEEFDLLNLRFFTDSDEGNPAEIDRFYGIRLEEFRGVNADIIQEGWGLYIKPASLKNYFAGNLGVGVENPSHKLTVSAVSDPVLLEGLVNESDNQFLTVDETGEVHRKSEQSMNENFEIVYADAAPDDSKFLYIHKGGDATYTLPPAASRAGKTWRFVNVGTGTITFSEAYLEGDETRSQLLNKSGHYSLELFSDGSSYIALK